MLKNNLLHNLQYIGYCSLYTLNYNDHHIGHLRYNDPYMLLCIQYMHLSIDHYILLILNNPDLCSLKNKHLNNFQYSGHLHMLHYIAYNKKQYYILQHNHWLCKN